jgi:hypothetical protein
MHPSSSSEGTILDPVARSASQNGPKCLSWLHVKSFEFCLPTKSDNVPDIHEVKYDGFRIRLERGGDRVRLITRGGQHSTRRYPWIVEAALKNRNQQFVIDGEGRRDDFLSSPGRVRGSPADWSSRFRFRKVRSQWGRRAGRCRAHFRF